MKSDCPSYYKLTLHEGTVREETIECVDVIKALIEANGLTGYEAYLYGNIVKYIWRCGRKGSLAIDLDKDVMTKVALYRGGGSTNDDLRNQTSQEVDKLFGQVNVAFEQYPDLKAHNEIEECLRQNSYLQKEITAAREVYNDTVYKWNSDIQEWPTKMIVAAKLGYTTRIPFTASQEIKQQARGVFF